MMLRTVLLILAILIAPWAAAEEEETEGDLPHFDFKPIQDDRREGLVQFLTSATQTELPQSKVIELEPAPADPAIPALWRGNEPQLSAEISSFKLKLAPQSARSESTPLLEVMLKYEPRGVVFQYSGARDPRFRNGLRFLPRLKPKTPPAGWRMFITGEKAPGLAFFIPRTPNGEQEVAAFCFRETVLPEAPPNPSPKPWEQKQAAKEKAAPEYRDAVYRITDAEFTVDGAAQGALLSGMGQGFAKALIQTSKNVVPAEPFYDYALRRDPTVAVNYLPALRAELDKAVSEDRVLGGVRSSLVLQLSSEHRRTTSLESVLSVSRITLDRPVQVDTGASEKEVGAGSCFVVNREKRRSTVYDTAELPYSE